MRKSGIFSLVIIVAGYTAGCDDTASTKCVVKEAILRDADRVFGKEVYTHDGSNYTESRFYPFDPTDNKYLEEPSNIGTFEYDDKGRIVKARWSDNNGRGYQQDQYVYIDGDVTTVDGHFTEMNSGTIITDATYQFQFVERPKDVVYQLKDYVEEYKDGNLIRREGPDFRTTFSYDNHPNITNDFPFLHWISGPNFGYCRNNLLQEVHDKGANYTRSYSFAFFGDGKLNRWSTEDTGRSMSFVYDCQ